MTAPVLTNGTRPDARRARPPAADPTGRAGEALHEARRTLATTLAARGALWGAAAGAGATTALVVALALRGVCLDVPGAVAAGTGYTVLGALVGAGAALLHARWRRSLSAEGVALWVEGRVPALRYALVTLVDGERSGAGAPGVVAALDRQVAGALAGVAWPAPIAGAWRRALRAPAIGVVLAAAALAVSLAAAPGVAERAARRIVGGGAGAGGAARGAARTASRLARVRAVVTPPAYSGLPSRRLDDATTVEALVGSVVALTGAGEPAGLRARVESGAGAAASRGDSLRVTAGGDGWQVAVPMPERPAAIRLEERAANRRLVVLAPRADSVPTVRLVTPVRDTILREPRGAVSLRATLDDDLGLAAGGFEYIVSSGDGESFTFKSGTLGQASQGGRPHGELRAALDVAALGLKPGDIVHVRAVARDRNPAAGRAAGTSETRTVRIARAGEYDSVSVDALPPTPGDTAALSQRMLLMLTEALTKRAPRLARDAVVGESRKIAADQARIRQRVGDVIFARTGANEEAGAEHSHFAGDGHNHGANENLKQLTPEELLEAASRATGAGAAEALEEGGDAPIVAINRPLLEAYNHMWDAGRALGVGEPARAVEPMRRAIAALQRARNAERIYLRGKPPTVIVDLAKVRGAGKLKADTLHAAARLPRAVLDAAARRRGERLSRALALLPDDAGAATDSLALLRVDALADAPALAAALGEALERLRAGRDATDALVRARRVASGEPAPAVPLGAWTGDWR